MTRSTRKSVMPRAVGDFAASWLAGKFSMQAENVLAEFADIESRGSSGDLFDQWLVRHGFALTWLPQVVQAFREHVPTISPFPSAPQVLRELRPAFQLGLVSDGYLVAQQKKLASLGLAPYFDAVVFSDVFGRNRWKPHACHTKIVCDSYVSRQMRPFTLVTTHRKTLSVPEPLAWAPFD